MSAGLTIGRVAGAVGVNIQTIRYYERLNLLQPTERRPSGYRIYGDEEVRRLRFIKNAQALGFTLHEITELLDLRVRSSSACAHVRGKAKAKLITVHTKIRHLQALARALRKLIHACNVGRSTGDCPILQSLEEERRTEDGNGKASR
jgi:MerR family mercuric resistance operon transcriptional regulator/MerR family gold-responsive transcriptional activator of gol and ges genes